MMGWRSVSFAAALTALCSISSAQPSSFATGAQVRQNAERGRGYDTVQFRRSGRVDRNAFRDRSYWDSRRGRGYYDRTYGRYRRDDSAAIAAGFLGFALGAAIAGSASERGYVEAHRGEAAWIANCQQRYRSFDPASGTYLGFDGYRHYCR
jgi:hypothetical protein